MIPVIASEISFLSSLSLTFAYIFKVVSMSACPTHLKAEWEALEKTDK